MYKVVETSAQVEMIYWKRISDGTGDDHENEEKRGNKSNEKKNNREEILH